MPGTFLCWLWSWLKPPLAWDGCFLVQRTLEMQRKHHLFKCLLRWHILRPSWWSRGIKRIVRRLDDFLRWWYFRKPVETTSYIYIYKTFDRGVCSYEVIGSSRVQVYYVAFQRIPVLNLDCTSIPKDCGFGSHVNCCHSVSICYCSPWSKWSYPL